ncbi:unnamed protein product [Oppiella nova]|uniref:Uncharacterized protein n=1 Tax=Oppiella nova TaxID=334625 RepID=A0A7R9LFB5_9ACAR|nr:unnamed protein product [Oppiella nova]CAG2162329.1 unnamed protein product [Oppiella nova]
MVISQRVLVLSRLLCRLTDPKNRHEFCKYWSSNETITKSCGIILKLNHTNNGSNGRHWMSSDMLSLLNRIFDTILLVSVLSYQNWTLSYFLTAFNAHNNLWYFFFFCDFVLAFLFISGAVVGCRHYRKLNVFRRSQVTDLNTTPDDNKLESNATNETKRSVKLPFLNITIPRVLGSLPLLWICWLLYTVLLSTKIFVLNLQNITVELYKSSVTEDSRVEAEPHTVRLCLALMTLVFILWVDIHRNPANKRSLECIKELDTITVIEIFDSIDLLDLLLPDGPKDMSPALHHSQWVGVVVLLLATINLMLPITGLFRLSTSDFSSHKLDLRMNILHNCLRISIINLPYLLLRLSFWISINKEISIFLFKNALFIFVHIRHIITEVHELRTLNKKPKENNELSLAVLSDDNRTDT